MPWYYERMVSRRYTLLSMVRIVWTIGWSDFFIKYRGSILGYLWSLISPLAKFLVIYYVFLPFVGDRIAQYPLYLFLGIIVWEHFTLATSHCMTVLQEKSSFIQKMPFPRILLIFIVGWTDLLVFLSYFLIFAAFTMLIGHGITIHWLYVPVIMIQMTLLSLGIGMVLASYCLRYRDILHLWGIATQVLFWLTPITYAYKLEAPVFAELRRMPEMLAAPSLHSIFDVFVQFQPLSLLIYDFRRVTLYPGTLGFPSWEHMLAVSAVLLLLFGIGTAVFRKRSRYFVEEY